ncbi:acyltransferase, partial [Nocardia cyriacigeorgica]|nr:acyltransferase [Nocardia cyriacigeorgica]
VVRDGEHASVTLLTHHSIADAVHSLAIFAELWRCYREAAAEVGTDSAGGRSNASGTARLTIPRAVSRPSTDAGYGRSG